MCFKRQSTSAQNVSAWDKEVFMSENKENLTENDVISSENNKIIDTSMGENEKTEKKPNRFISWLKKIKPSKRKIIQLYSALLFNAKQ